VSIVAWVATPTDIAAVADPSILWFVRPGRAHDLILAAEGEGAQASGSCALLTDRPVPFLDGFSAPAGERWREYVAALTRVALRRAAELGYEVVEADVYEYGDATREPLNELGFAPPHERSRIWRAAT
jgi:hypothetical protein